MSLILIFYKLVIISYLIANRMLIHNLTSIVLANVIAFY
jgi:hypothetical protein